MTTGLQQPLQRDQCLPLHCVVVPERPDIFSLALGNREAEIFLGCRQVSLRLHDPHTRIETEFCREQLARLVGGMIVGNDDFSCRQQAWGKIFQYATHKKAEQWAAIVGGDAD